MMKKGNSKLSYGITLINDNCFEDYAEQTANDVCGEDFTKWPLNCIDWEEAAELLKNDYSSIEIGEDTYYYLP